MGIGISRLGVSVRVKETARAAGGVWGVNIAREQKAEQLLTKECWFILLVLISKQLILLHWIHCFFINFYRSACCSKLRSVWLNVLRFYVIDNSTLLFSFLATFSYITKSICLVSMSMCINKQRNVKAKDALGSTLARLNNVWSVSWNNRILHRRWI